MQTIADHAPALIAQFDSNLRHLFVNEAVAEATELPVEAFLGRTTEELGMPAKLIATWNATLREAFASGRVQRNEFSFPTPAGERHYSGVAAPETTDAGEVLSVVSVVQDVTDMKAAERASRENAERYERIFENVAVGIAQVGLDGILHGANRRLAEILGYEPEDLVGLRPEDITHPDDLGADLAHAEALLRGDIPHYRLDKRYIRKDGDILWGRLSTSLACDAEGRPSTSSGCWRTSPPPRRRRSDRSCWSPW